MIDYVGVALTILGWIVAGYVTLYGIRRSERENRRRQARAEWRELCANVLRPLHTELDSFLGIEDSGYKGYLLWAIPTKEYRGIESSGLLFNDRLKDVREDVDKLTQIHRTYEKAFRDLAEQIVKSIQEVWKDVYLEVGHGAWDEQVLSYMLAPGQGPLDPLWSALFVGDQGAFVNALLNATANIQSKGAVVRNLDLGTLYRAARASVEPLTQSHDERLKAFLEQAKWIRERIRVTLLQPSEATRVKAP